MARMMRADLCRPAAQPSLFRDSRRGGALSCSAPSGPFSFIDLFAGIGGMRMGFEAAGGRCVFTCEWNKYSQQTYRANFTCNHPIDSDIRDLAETDIPAHDLLVAGFPCQPFSIAGVSKKNALGRPHGFRCQTQGTLFFDIARMIAFHRPAAFLLENVKNLESHDHGRTFATIMATLCDDLGYDVQARVVDAAGLVPQHRERILIVGFREPADFDLEEVDFGSRDTGPRLASILHPEDGSEQEETPYTGGRAASVNPKYTLSAKLWQYLQDYAAKHKEKGNGFGFGLAGREDIARTLSARYYKDGSEILIRQPDRPRRLTPRECARLMGFDGRRGSRFRIPVSDMQAYKQFGNAVVVPVIAAIAHAMKPHILAVRNHPRAMQPV